MIACEEITSRALRNCNRKAKMLSRPPHSEELKRAVAVSEEKIQELRWAKLRDSYRRIASESYRCDSNRKRSVELISPPKAQDWFLIGLAFVALRFESRDWCSLVSYAFHMELRNGLREFNVGRVR